MKKRKISITVLVSLLLTICLSFSSLAGSWHHDSVGWWYQKDDGSYPKNSLVHIDNFWYGFDQNGYMMSERWVQAGGKWYYLTSSGKMAVSQWIAGKYYVGDDGVMLTNAWTPDGYYVDGSGVWDPSATRSSGTSAGTSAGASSSTSAVSENGTWVLTDTIVSITEETVYPDTYIYTYEGQKDGRVWMKYAYRWSYGKEYTSADVYFGCDVPPSSIPAGRDVVMDMTYIVDGLRGWKYSGIIAVPTGRTYIYEGYPNTTNKLEDVYGKEYLWPGEENTNYIAGDLNVTRTFSDSTPKSKTKGDIMQIMFQCSAGTITWKYTLQ